MIITYGQPVRVTVNAGAAGKVKSDFTINLTEEGLASALPVTVTELTNAGQGIYEIKFQPPNSSVKKKYMLHVIYNDTKVTVDSGWEIEYLAPIAGQEIRLYVQGTTTGLAITPYSVIDGNTASGMTWNITENATAFGANIYQAVATLPDSANPYWLHARFVCAADNMDTGFDIYVEPSINHAQTLTNTLRERLGNPDPSEISDSQLFNAIKKCLLEFSNFKPRVEYDSSMVCVSGQMDYTLPADTSGIRYCRIASTLAGITDYWLYFEDWAETMRDYTGCGNIYWKYVNGKLRFVRAPAAAENGYYIGLLLYKNHVFTNSVCLSATDDDMELVLLGAEGMSREIWAGYAGTVRQGSASEDKENQRTRGKEQWKEFQQQLALEVRY
jgi:hypothetical protein